MSPQIEYDVSEVPELPPSTELRREVKKAPKIAKRRRASTAVPEPGSFEARVAARQVDLLKLIDNGLPPIEFLPASDGMLVRGKRHLIAAPHKTGKSIGMLVHWVEMAMAGAVVVILDRENGQDEYARRLADILQARHLTKSQRARVGRGLRYYEFPQLQDKDAAEMADYFGDADVVVFDAQRMFLSDFGLKESEADDYARFMSYVVDPLFTANVATVILDNTGHKDKERARGSVAKGDLNEVLFSMTTTAEFDTSRRGKLRLHVEHSRFGNRGEWTMDIGAGTYSPWTSAEAGAKRDDFLVAITAVLSQGGPLGVDKLIARARIHGDGLKIGTPLARAELKRYAEDPSIAVIQGAEGYELNSN